MTYFSRFIRTYMITRNTCIAEHREARGGGGGNPIRGGRTGDK